MASYIYTECDVCTRPTPTGRKRHHICSRLYYRYYNRYYQNTRYRFKRAPTEEERAHIKRHALSNAKKHVNNDKFVRQAIKHEEDAAAAPGGGGFNYQQLPPEPEAMPDRTWDPQEAMDLVEREKQRLRDEPLLPKD